MDERTLAEIAQLGRIPEEWESYREFVKYLLKKMCEEVENRPLA